MSAGIAVYRRRAAGVELLLVHPGGPFWAKKDLGAWSFPKGEHSADEDALAAARREFEEELGVPIDGDFIALPPRRQAGGKLVSLWLVEGDMDAASMRSNTFTMEWPPRSGKQAEFPEVDRAEWFDVEEARARLTAGQAGFVDEIVERLAQQE